VNKISVLIVDDETLLRQGLRAMLEKEPFVNSIYEAENDEELKRHLLNQHINVVLLDIRLGKSKSNGVELLHYLRSISAPPKVIVLTGLDGVELIINLLKSNCDGIVYKLDGYKEIVKTLNAILNGQNYFPDKILKIIQNNAKRWEQTPSVLLTFHEKELLRAIAGGGTTKQIASELRLKIATAETYRIRLMKKVGVSNTASLLAYAFRNGIL
jgi:DNA-binding NarL/FixJ family response regulator